MNMIISLLLSKCKDNVYNVILVMIDHYIKMTRYLSTTNKLTAVKLTDMFFEHIVLQYKTLRRIVSDQESIFTKQLLIKSMLSSEDEMLTKHYLSLINRQLNQKTELNSKILSLLLLHQRARQLSKSLVSCRIHIHKCKASNFRV